MFVFRAQLTKAYSLLRYGFEPRLNSLAHVTAGSGMIIGLSIKEMLALGKEVRKYKTRWT